MDATFQNQEMLTVMRVLRSGIIMSIERNQRELHRLESALCKKYNFAQCSLFNSFQGGLHAVLVSRGFFHGASVDLEQQWQGSPAERFIHYLGIQINVSKPVPNKILGSGYWDASQDAPYAAEGHSDTLLVDLTGLGYGPASAFLSQHQRDRKIAEELKIFGERDLKVMWEKVPVEHIAPPFIQYNYRMSPLVAALINQKIGGVS